MAKFDVQVKNIPGKTNVADALSHTSCIKATMSSPETPMIEVDLITRTSPASLNEIQNRTAEDPVLYHLRDEEY